MEMTVASPTERVSLGVSVVICCHNSAKRLPETLRHLAVQQVPVGVSWEVVVINNASTDDTSDIALRCWPNSSPAPLRIVDEPKRGTANARFRSFSEAKYPYISFLDDDNWVGPDWIAKVVKFFASHPEASVVGGPSRPVFETDPPPWFTNISSYYAVGIQHGHSGDITHQRGTLLWTAGMSLKRQLTLKLLEENFRFLTCIGDDLAIQRGEDTELCFAIRAIGGSLYYDPEMVVEHFMPTERLTWPKALKQVDMLGGASPILDLYLIALDVFPYADCPEWKKSWLFHLLKTLWQIVGLTVIHPLDCQHQPEGSSVALRYETIKAQLVTLWRIRRRYHKLRNLIARSPWANIQQKTHKTK